ncbi:MAG: hypothetical protein M1454_04250 [Candidatus Thermoplasmatota archaeon]|nr:hypothetical protein [Candidatus Thermoplasmatota archaeon]MCL5730494.1 hypothetical protein [Candidatus Thermoplasmatota archaeon]
MHYLSKVKYVDYWYEQIVEILSEVFTFEKSYYTSAILPPNDPIVDLHGLLIDSIYASRNSLALFSIALNRTTITLMAVGLNLIPDVPFPILKWDSRERMAEISFLN